MKYIKLFENQSEYSEYAKSQSVDSYIMDNGSTKKYPLTRSQSNDITVSCDGKVNIILEGSSILCLMLRSSENDFEKDGVQYYTFSLYTYEGVYIGLTRNNGEDYTDSNALLVMDGGYTPLDSAEVSFINTGIFYAYLSTELSEYVILFLKDFAVSGTYENETYYLSNDNEITAGDSATLIVKRASATPYIEPHVSYCLAEKSMQYDKERIKPLKLSSPDECTFSRATGLTYETLCSTNGKTWFNYTNDDNPIMFGNGVDLYIKGINPKFEYYSEGALCSPFNIDGTNIEVSGSNLSLINGDGYVLDCDSCITPRLFDNCTGLVNASKLKFYSVSEFNYQNMFGGCTSLVNAPELPATTLSKLCYANMFDNCTSLVNAPKLPATTLANDCYTAMFIGCTSLVNAPALPATTLTESCYSYMFYGCTSLVNAPALPATTLTWNCYSNMFSGCTSLVNAPTLPATTLTEYCYSYMFSGCTSLVNAPEISATTLALGCCRYMFFNCVSLVNSPALPATTLSQNCYSNMFNSCTSLVNAPALPATTLVGYCYSNMFLGCTSLVNAPELPATTLAYQCYSNMFNKCTSLVNAPALPATTLAYQCYQDMFYGCTSLVNAPALPATTLATECYFDMFSGCTSLVNAPTLPATTLADYCYSKMFLNCSSLNHIKMMATDISTNGCLNDWLTRVSSTGTFECAVGMSSKFISGSSGIPGGWSVTEVAS